MGLFRIDRRYKHLGRYRQVAEVFIRHGFGYAFERSGLRHRVPLFRKKTTPDAELTTPRGRRLRRAFEELGVTFIKLGQLLSTRADLIPEDILSELQRLQDDVPPFPSDQALQVIEAELGRPWHEAFDRVELQPIAAASVAQVHRARLKTGEDVVIKVQRPGIREQIRVDLEILAGLAGLVQDRLRPEFFDLRELVDEFSRQIRRELDFVNEGGHIDRFREQFQDDPSIVIPKVYWDFTTERMLVMDWIDGTKVLDIEGMKEKGIDRRIVARKGAEAFLRQVMIHGYFHGDPHPGNIFVLPGNRIAYIDFGVVGRLSEDAKAHLADLFLGIIRRDVDRVIRGMTRLGAVDDTVNLRRMRTDVADLVDRHYGKALKDVKAADVFNDALELAQRNHVRLPSDLFLLGRALLTVEGMGERLDPDFNVVEIAEPFARELIRRRLHPRRVLERAAADLGEYLEIAARLPGRIDRLLEQAERGRTSIRFRHEGLDNLIDHLDILSNRVAMALIIASLVIGSSMVIQSDVGPRIWGYPALGVLGYLAAFFMGVWLLVGILRSGRF